MIELNKIYQRTMSRLEDEYRINDSAEQRLVMIAIAVAGLFVMLILILSCWHDA